MDIYKRRLKPGTYFFLNVVHFRIRFSILIKITIEYCLSVSRDLENNQSKLVTNAPHEALK